MKNDELAALMRKIVRDDLSPSEVDRTFVTTVYESIRSLLGEGNTLQIGSYPRFTAVRPLHDLDVLYVLGNWDPETHDPSAALAALEALARSTYRNPTEYRVEISRQTHSVTIKFYDRRDEVFAVDIVPAYVEGLNDFRQDKYVVPEIALQPRAQRLRTYAETASRRHEMRWIKSDPRGYIEVSRRLNDANPDFRKAAKFVKSWRASCKRADDEFPLKSFHAEIAIAHYFGRNAGASIFDAVFAFFCSLPDYLTYPQFPDRADATKNIDDYVAGISHADRKKALEYRDAFLIALEQVTTEADVRALLLARRHKRAGSSEAYLFDQRIPVLVDAEVTIRATVLAKPGFLQSILSRAGIILADRQIKFEVGPNPPVADLFKWKVKNDDDCGSPRGEITDHRTYCDPERTAYRGNHYVECFAIRGGVCIAKAKQNVVLEGPYVRKI